MQYSLWDTEIGSRLGRFRTKEDALAFVGTMLATYPRAKLRETSLNWRDEHGNCGEAITGEVLLARAERAAAKGEPITAGGGAASLRRRGK
jgi:hypothetical protein